MGVGVRSEMTGNKREKQGLDRILDPRANGASLSN